MPRKLKHGILLFLEFFSAKEKIREKNKEERLYKKP